MTVQPGLCQTWLEPKLLVFSRTGSLIISNASNFKALGSNFLILSICYFKCPVADGGGGGGAFLFVQYHFTILSLCTIHYHDSVDERLPDMSKVDSDKKFAL